MDFKLTHYPMTLPALFIALCTLSPSAAQQSEATPAAHKRGEPSLADLIERDRRVSFSLSTRASAVATLSRTTEGDQRKAVALMALGAGRVQGERPRIESWAQEGQDEVRRAAVLALGELGLGDTAVLIEFAADTSESIAESALMALSRCDAASGAAFVDSVARDASHPLAARARSIQAFAAGAFAADPTSASDLEVVRRLYELRFAAARSYGLVDGQSWDVLVLGELCQDSRFLNRVIYRAASELKRPGIRDHFFEIALEKGAPERLRGVVNAIPAELSQMIESGAFVPADEREWSTLLTEIDERRLEGFTDPILRRAFLLPALRGTAGVLLARAGSAGSVPLLEIGLESEDPAERASCARALGATGLAEYLTSLRALEHDPDPRVRATALIAQVRLGSQTAYEQVRGELGLESTEGQAVAHDARWFALVEALGLNARDVRARPMLLAVLPELPNEARATASAALLEAGQAEVRPWMREYLRNQRPSGAFGARCAAALASGAPSLEDLQVLRALFPVEGDIELNVELACALLELKDSEILPVLRASLWSEPVNRSILTGALWIETAGLDGLRIEVLHPPVGASPRDLRRVGFALGEWGGVNEVEWLAERLNVGEPALQGAVIGALQARTH